jgi:hypothetical protein
MLRPANFPAHLVLLTIALRLLARAELAAVDPAVRTHFLIDRRLTLSSKTLRMLFGEHLD